MSEKYTVETVKQLREITGAGILDCKNALNENNGDIEKAAEYLNKKNLASLSKRKDREAKEGKVVSYIHGDGRIGTMVEVNCETDFVARTEEFRIFANEICLQVCGMSPEYIDIENIPSEKVEKQKEIFMAQAKETGKPENVLDKIVEGKIKKWYQEACLMEQPYFKDEKKLIKDLLAEIIGKTGENVRIKRFARFQLGEAV
jgi:elongation factor Ts